MMGQRLVSMKDIASLRAQLGDLLLDILKGKRWGWMLAHSMLDAQLVGPSVVGMADERVDERVEWMVVQMAVMKAG